MATIGTKNRVPAFARLNNVLLAIIGTNNFANVYVCQRFAQTNIRCGTKLIAGAFANFHRSAPTISTGTTNCVNASAMRSKIAAQFIIGIRNTANVFANML